MNKRTNESFKNFTEKDSDDN